MLASQIIKSLVGLGFLINLSCADAPQSPSYEKNPTPSDPYISDSLVDLSDDTTIDKGHPAKLPQDESTKSIADCIADDQPLGNDSFCWIVEKYAYKLTDKVRTYQVLQLRFDGFSKLELRKILQGFRTLRNRMLEDAAERFAINTLRGDEAKEPKGFDFFTPMQSCVESKAVQDYLPDGLPAALAADPKSKIRMQETILEVNAMMAKIDGQTIHVSAFTKDIKNDRLLLAHTQQGVSTRAASVPSQSLDFEINRVGLSSPSITRDILAGAIMHQMLHRVGYRDSAADSLIAVYGDCMRDHFTNIVNTNNKLAFSIEM